MTDLKTTYMGLNLKNPIIAGSSNMSGSIEKIKKLEENGVAAIVLKSIFEEQILNEIGSLSKSSTLHTEGYDYISQYTKQFTLNNYLNLIKKSKEQTDIPIIASINCISNGEWISFAKQISDAGADAIELNLFVLPSDTKKEPESIEKTYFDIIKSVTSQTDIPISIKVSSYFTSLANSLFRISLTDISGIVLFNRFYQPDIDLKKMELISSDIFSTRRENSHSLRWIGILSGSLKCDIISSTGIHEGVDVLKNILVGANAVQVVSTIYKNGMEHIQKMINDLTELMDEHNFESISGITGKLNQKNSSNPEMFERAQFMKYYANT